MSTELKNTSGEIMNKRLRNRAMLWEHKAKGMFSSLDYPEATIPEAHKPHAHYRYQVTIHAILCTEWYLASQASKRRT